MTQRRCSSEHLEAKAQRRGDGNEGPQKPECVNTVGLQVLFRDSHHGLSSSNDRGWTWDEGEKVYPLGVNSATSPGWLEGGPTNLSDLFF